MYFSLRKQCFTREEFWRHYEEQRQHDPSLSERGQEQVFNYKIE